MNEFSDHLQSVLGDRYRIERELGGGGMSRVFLAEENRLGRMVVIKVLPPATTASIEAGRFEREIQVAGSLHHPHIVQLLATGEGDGVLWYAMPFVEGESLSERLQRSGPLPVTEAVRLLREVADALAYAHARGIVHRDIKPANIMLAGRHAMVTDFGVAKALAAGKRTDAPEQPKDLTALTSVGMALGTPAYMAPEQAVADPNVDHRADIYSLGVVAYEMLVGGSPYQATTPQAMLAAHVTQPPTPIAARRADLPPDLAAIVMKCLAKAPSDRYATASELVDALESVGTPSSGTAAFDATAVARNMFRKWHPGRVVVMQLLATLAVTGIVFGLTRVLGLPDWIWWAIGGVMLLGIPPLMIASRNERRRAHATMTGTHAAVQSGEFTGEKAIRGGMIAVGAVALLAVGFIGAGVMGVGPGATLLSRGSLGANAGVVLAEFDVTGSDSTLSGAILEALRVDLSQSKAIHLLQGPEITDALGRANLPGTSRLTASIAREVAQRANAKAVVTGEVHTLGGGFVLTASITDATSAQPLAQVRETAASDKELIPAVNRLSKALREKIGESLRSIRASEPLEQVTTASLPALRIYSTAQKAYDASDYEQARVQLLQALAIDSTFAMAWRKLAVTYNSLGVNEAGIEASKHAYQLRERLPPLERHLTEANYLYAVVHDESGAVAAYRAVLELNPNDKTSLNNAGLILNQIGKFDEAEVYLRRAAAAGLFNSYTNLVFSLAAQEKFAALDSLPQQWAEHGGDSGRALFLQYGAAFVRRDAAGLDSFGARGLKASPPGSLLRVRFLNYTAQAIETRGELEHADRVFKDFGAHSADLGNRVGLLEAELKPAFQSAVQRGKPAEAWALAEQALARHPLDSLAPRDRPYGELAQLAAMVGRPAEVKKFRAAWEGAIPAAERDSIAILFWDASAALAAEQWDAAAAGFRRANAAAHCLPCGAYQWAYALDRGGHADSAAAVFERIVKAPNTDFLDLYDDAAWFPLANLKLGEYYQAKGDKTKALAYLTQFTTLWKNADADLQPKVREAKARIADLSGDKRP